MGEERGEGGRRGGEGRGEGERREEREGREEEERRERTGREERGWGKGEGNENPLSPGSLTMGSWVNDPQNLGWEHNKVRELNDRRLSEVT